MTNNKKVLVLGGAGFIGSMISERFFNEGFSVTVIDGLLEQTGGLRKNLNQILPYIQFIDTRIEDIGNFSDLVSPYHLIIDCMAWTSHHLALSNPLYDLQLNASSHLHVLSALDKNVDRNIIFLGSRGQYGNPKISIITEETPMLPEDIQAVHKVAAESYYRLFAKFKRLNVISIRLSNCFGERQLAYGSDIGLVGGFIRDLLQGQTLDVYGERKRNLLYVGDLTEIIVRLSSKNMKGFNSFNVIGQEITIQQLVEILISIIGSGKYYISDIPQYIKEIDMGNAIVSDEKIRALLGDFSFTDLRSSLSKTVNYFKHELMANDTNK